MKSVIGVGKLIGILEENKKKHRNLFLKALDGYKKKAIETLEDKLEKVKNNKKLPMIQIYLPIPEDHTSDYERVILLLELDARANVDLTETDFAQYVMDDWGWKDQWTTSNSAYLGG